MATNVYETITDKIVAAIEAGAGNWRMPWHRTGGGSVQPVNLHGRAYRGANTVALWCEAQARGYESPMWGTYKAFGEKNAQVRRGEKSTLVVFWKSTRHQTTDPVTNETTTSTHLFARGYHVFNIAQVDNYVAKEKVIPELDLCERIDRAESFFSRIDIPVKHGGDRAFYVPSRDYIQLPEFRQFKGAEDYYSTRAHETGHATGHPSRLAREFGKRFSDTAYAMEELTAELTAAYVCGHLNLSNEPRPDHAQYLSGWLATMKKDARAIFTVASRAQAAADWIIAAAGESEESAESDDNLDLAA